MTQYLFTLIFTIILTFRDISILGSGIYFFEFSFSIGYILYSIISKKIAIVYEMKYIYYLLLVMILYDIIFFSSDLGNYTLVMGNQINVLFSIALITFLNSYSLIDQIKISKNIFLGILVFNGLYLIIEIFNGPGLIDLVHKSQSDTERYRFLYNEPSYAYVPIFCAALATLHNISKNLSKLGILIITIIFMMLNGSKSFFLTYFLAVIIFIFMNFKSFEKKNSLIFYIVTILIIIYAMNNDKIYNGFINPLINSDINIIESLLSNEDNINTGSFQTRLVSIVSGLIVFWNSNFVGVGSQLEAMEIAKIIEQNKWFNLELIDAYVSNPNALTSKSYLVSLLASYGLVSGLLFFKQIYNTYAIAYSKIYKFIVVFLMISTFISEGVNFLSLLVLIYYNNKRDNLIKR